ncbi:MAG: hydrogenase nickel incorporation protein HypB [Xanthobacteraceae bacterium]|nr:hydrogenase nickel incorporation protein HypB [Xanthobacteraceae bacterium]
MCRDCGCGATDRHHLHDTNGARVDVPPRRTGRLVANVLADLHSANRKEAGHNRDHFDRYGVLAINLTSSPGAGKTALLEATIDRLGAELGIAVIEGDLETENDANRIRAKGVPAVQITTGNACHLDAVMVHDALHHLDLSRLDILFIENVGNLVCPAAFDLGQHHNVTLLSATEGDDKPAKYPVMFRGSDLVVVTKTDLLPHLDDFDLSRVEASLRASGYTGPLLKTTTKREDGPSDWIGWLRRTIVDHRRKQGPAADGARARVHIHAASGHSSERKP